MKTFPVKIGPITIGGENPIVIQSMTDTDTADIPRTVAQIKELHEAGAEIVRIAVNSPKAAKAVPSIRAQLNQEGFAELPLVGDFHFNGHILLKKFPEMAMSLSKYRINPGNLGLGKGKDEHFADIIEVALRNEKPIRIGVNVGSLDKELLSAFMTKNAKQKKPLSTEEVMIEAVTESALQSAQFAEKLGMPKNRIVLSVKMSKVPAVIQAYELLHQRCKTQNRQYPLHLGLTEAGPGFQGVTASAAALGILLHQGIGDTIRISLSPGKGYQRTDEVKVARSLLQSLDLRKFEPKITSCPGCGRTVSKLYQELAEKTAEYIKSRMPHWKKQCPGVETMTVSVMGCVVNGPGESAMADIGISLPGKSEKPLAQVYRNGKPFRILKGGNVTQEFLSILEDYVINRYSCVIPTEARPRAERRNPFP